MHHSRRHSTQIPLHPNDQLHHHLPRIFSGHIPERTTNDTSSDDTKPSEEESPKRKKTTPMNDNNNNTSSPPPPSSRRAKHLSLPTYTRTMHAFTLNQLNDMANTGSHRRTASSAPTTQHQREQASKSPTSNPLQPSTTKTLLIPIPSASSPTSQLQHLTLDEAPYGPANTPESGAALMRPVATFIAAAPATSGQDLWARGKELEERFEAMTGGGGGGGDAVGMEWGGRSQVRDFAAQQQQGVGVGSF